MTFKQAAYQAAYELNQRIQIKLKEERDVLERHQNEK